MKKLSIFYFLCSHKTHFNDTFTHGMSLIWVICYVGGVKKYDVRSQIAKCPASLSVSFKRASSFKSLHPFDGS